MRASLAPVALALAALAAGCDWLELGTEPEDNEKLADIPALRHINKSVRGGSSMQVKDLFKDFGVTFHSAPDPSARLVELHDANNQRATRSGTSLGVLTYNTALLHAQPFGVIEYAKSPELETRRVYMPRILMSQGYDILMLQEVWNNDDVDTFRAQADGYGYRVFAQNRNQYTDGLVVLVRSAILAADKDPEVAHVPYDKQDPKEFIPGVSVKRGYLHVSVTLKDGTPLHLFDTHVQAFPDQWKNRMWQARQLGLAVRDAAGDNDLAIVAGDMNAGSFYRHDSWQDPQRKTVKDWWANAVSWGLLQHYGQLADAFAMGQAAQDVEFGKMVVNNPDESTHFPGATRTWCQDVPAGLFTATDCNSLYFKQYAGTEYPARMDHIMLRDPHQKIWVVASGLEFTAPRSFGDQGTFELSDHYGVHATLLVAP